MYIELYLDVLFFLNMCVNYLLLRSVQILTGRPLNRIRCLTGGAIGAFGVCILLCLPIRMTYANLLPVQVVTSTLMVKIGCKIKDAKNLCIGLLALYLTGFLWGGVFLWLYQIMDVIHLHTFLFLSIIFYELLAIGVRTYRRIKKYGDRYCNVTLYVKEKSKKVRGLYDTGNLLQDPVTKAPVSVAEAQLIRCLLEEAKISPEHIRPHYIPYQAVGVRQGVLLAVTITAMEVERNGRMVRIEKPVLALSKETVSFTRHYQLILNPDLINS